MIIDHEFAGRHFLAKEWETAHFELQRASLATFNSENNLRDMFWHFNVGDVVFDVGAGFGNYTFPALVQGAKVWAFEPDPEMRGGLISNLKLNSVGYSIVDAVNNVVITNPCTITTFGLGGVKSEIEYVPGYSKDQMFIQIETLDSLTKIRNFSRIDMIKLDTEGLELSILMSSISTLQKFKPKLLIELHKFMDRDIETKIRGFLSNFNYSFELIPYDDMVDHLFCK